jgi:hypothetical protein
VVRRVVPILLVLAVVIGAANFLWCLTDIVRAGGVPEPVTASGVYQVNNHGVMTDVSKDTYDWLAFHLNTVIVTQVLGIGAIGVGLMRLNRWIKTGD